MTTFRDLTPEEEVTLQHYAEYHGKNWKQQLLDDWFNGRDAQFPNGHYLRVIRNQLGPQWLEQFDKE